MHDFLPRQARDKHRENSKKSGVPLAHVGFFDCVDDESVLIYENKHIFFGHYFVLKMYRFTKTGSGQTYGKHSKRDLCVFLQVLDDLVLRETVCFLQERLLSVRCLCIHNHFTKTASGRTKHSNKGRFCSYVGWQRQTAVAAGRVLARKRPHNEPTVPAPANISVKTAETSATRVS